MINCPLFLFLSFTIEEANMIKRTFFLLFGMFLLFPLYAQSPRFVEKEGIVVIEMESIPLSTGWQISKDKGNPTGDGYIIWTGSQSFNNTGIGRLLYPVQINTPGTYRFDWRVGVGNGTSSTEHNDTWLKIQANQFFGLKQTSKIKPKPACNTDPEYACPKGSSVNGFFKLFGGALNNFQWKAVTSDADDHVIYATFDSPGQYVIEVNARSSFHMLDRMVLYNETKYTQAQARDLSRLATTHVVTSTTVPISQLGVNVFPIPFQTEYVVENASNKTFTYQLVNEIGQMIQTGVLLPGRNTFSVSALENGVYFLYVYDRKNQQAIQKLVKQD